MRVRGLTRGKKPLESDRLAWIEGPLESIRALDELLHGATHLVHLAGRVRGNTREEFVRTNTDATRRLIERCARMQRPPRFLFVSSLAARHPELSYYANSKHLAEKCLCDESSRLEWTVFRPPAVYGPGDTQVRPLLRLASKGVFIVPTQLYHRLSLIHVQDLVDAITAWIYSSDPSGKIFELSDPALDGYSWHQVVQILSEHYGRKVRPLGVPRFLLALTGIVNLGLGRLIGRPTFLSPGKAREFTHPDWVADSSAAQQALDWQPQIGLAQGLGNLD